MYTLYLHCNVCRSETGAIQAVVPTIEVAYRHIKGFVSVKSKDRHRSQRHLLPLTTNHVLASNKLPPIQSTSSDGKDISASPKAVAETSDFCDKESTLTETADSKRVLPQVSNDADVGCSHMGTNQPAVRVVTLLEICLHLSQLILVSLLFG